MESVRKISKQSLKITASDLDYGWSDIDIEIGEEKYLIHASYIGECLACLVDRLYYLYPELGHDEYDFGNVEYGSCEGPFEYNDGKEEIVTWEDVPRSTSLQMDEEGYLWTFTIEREVTLKCDFDITLTIKNMDGKIDSYCLKYKDLCYAVAKCCTDMLKQYGLSGYVDSAWDKDINIRRLIFIKAVAMDCIERIKSNTDSKSDISNELAVLMADM